MILAPNPGSGNPRQSTALHGIACEFRFCRALPLAPKRIWSEGAYVGAPHRKPFKRGGYMSVKEVSIGFAGAMLAVLAGVGGVSGISRAQTADNDEAIEQSRIRRGFEIAPVPLNLQGRNRQLVGLGSYMVNAVGSCNMCHSGGTSSEYAKGGNPYFKGGPATVVNQATYLGGGRVFAAPVGGVTPSIVSRNLTPDKTGLPVGGRTFAEFR